MGFGMGFLSNAAIVIIQESVDWAERGAATASNMFSRNLGSTLGATIMGGVLNLGLSHDPNAFEAVRRLLDGSGNAATDATVRSSLGHSLHLAFCVMFATTILTLLLAMLVPPVVIGEAKRSAPAG